MNRLNDSPVLPESKTLTAHAPEPAVASPRIYLIIITDKTSAHIALPHTGMLVIGRDPDADIQVDDPVVSRRHARLLMSDGRVRIEDLGSHNGTRLNGHRIAEAMPLFAGDEVVIGPAVLVLHAQTQAAGQGQTRTKPPGRPLLDADGLQRQLGMEIERAAFNDRALAVVALHVDGPASTRGRVQVAVTGMLRGCDSLGLTDDDYLVAILPELHDEEAYAMARRLEQSVRTRAGARRCGLACFPGDAGEAMALLGAARAAAVKPGEVGEARQQALQIAFDARRPPLWLADPTMIHLYNRLLRRLATSDLPVLIQGETGTGKESVAYAVHCWSSRQERPFVPLNCAALQESLAESELFGHEKGAFTGASESKPGHFERARGGTLFLDEVGELSLNVQAKLLRALESKQILRLGGKKELEIDVRLVAATNRNLADEVKQGRFREDLYFRLKGARVIVPPLRDRPRELALLAEKFLVAARTRSHDEPLTLSAAALQQLRSHPWPGNVRELKNAMEYVATTVDEGVQIVQPWHLPDEVCEPGVIAEVKASERSPNVEANASGEVPGGGAALTSAMETVPDSPAAARRRPLFRPLAEEVRDLEQRRMREALEATGWIQTRAAALLKVPLRTFVWKLKLYGLKRPDLETTDDGG